MTSSGLEAEMKGRDAFHLLKGASDAKSLIFRIYHLKLRDDTETENTRNLRRECIHFESTYKLLIQMVILTCPPKCIPSFDWQLYGMHYVRYWEC